MWSTCTASFLLVFQQTAFRCLVLPESPASGIFQQSNIRRLLPPQSLAFGTSARAFMFSNSRMLMKHRQPPQANTSWRSHRPCGVHAASPSAPSGYYGSYYGSPAGGYGTPSPPAPLFGPPVSFSPAGPPAYGSPPPAGYRGGSYSPAPAPGLFTCLAYIQLAYLQSPRSSSITQHESQGNMLRTHLHLWLPLPANICVCCGR